MKNMGYLYNHLATVVCGVFAATLTGLWPVFVDFAPILNFVFMMAVPIMWFITFTCWIVQKSNDYMKKHHGHHHDSPLLQKTKQKPVFTSDGKVVTHS